MGETSDGRRKGARCMYVCALMIRIGIIQQPVGWEGRENWNAEPWIFYFDVCNVMYGRTYCSYVCVWLVDWLVGE